MKGLYFKNSEGIEMEVVSEPQISVSTVGITQVATAYVWACPAGGGKLEACKIHDIGEVYKPSSRHAGLRRVFVKAVNGYSQREAWLHNFHIDEENLPCALIEDDEGNVCSVFSYQIVFIDSDSK